MIISARKPAWRVVSVCVGVVLFGGASAAVAQADQQSQAGAQTAQERTEVDTRRLEEITVTARRRVERLQDLPFSGTALTEGLLRDIGGIRSVRDMMDLAVGVTTIEANSGDLSEPNIRGAGQSRNRMSPSATGIYRNGAYFASSTLGGRQFQRFDTFDVERVEVLRGSQGALYGRNALGGAINMISKRPAREFDLEVGASAGENDRRGFEAIVNAPLTDILAARFSLVTERQRDGFYKDLDGNPVDKTKYDHVRASVGLNPNERLDVTYSLDYMEEENPIGIRVRRAGSVLNLTGGDPFQTTINSEMKTVSEVSNHNLLVNYELDSGTVSSVTNFRQRDVKRFQDGDHQGPSAAAATRNLLGFTDVDADILFQELRFVSNMAGAVEYLVAADLYTVDTTEYIDNFVRGGQTVATSSIRNVAVDQLSWAVYGSVDYNFENLPLTISAEARYAVDTVDGDVRTVLPNQNDLVTTDVSDKSTFRNLPWGISASWRFDDPPVPAMGRSMLYGKIATSYRHGGLNLNEGLPTDRFPTKALYSDEDSLTYELGIKSSWLDGRLTFNGAAFWIEYSDFLDSTTNGCPEQCTYFDPDTFETLGFDGDGNQITLTDDGREGLASPQAVFIDNVGEVDAWGVELELSWRHYFEATAGRLSTNIGWGRQMGEVKSLSDDVSEAASGNLGKPLNRLRPRQISGNIVYRQPLPFMDRMGLRGTELMVSTTYVHEHGGYRNLSSDPWPLESVDRMNAAIGLDTDSWRFTIRGSNILDKEYEVWGNANLFRLNEPRYFWAEFSWRLR
jgi:iron complex outermembrane recepter protein